MQLLFQPAGMSPAISWLTAYNLVIVSALSVFTAFGRERAYQDDGAELKGGLLLLLLHNVLSAQGQTGLHAS